MPFTLYMSRSSILISTWLRVAAQTHKYQGSMLSSSWGWDWPHHNKKLWVTQSAHLKIDTCLRGRAPKRARKHFPEAAFWLTRSLLRTLCPFKTHYKTPSKNIVENLLQSPFREPPSSWSRACCRTASFAWKQNDHSWDLRCWSMRWGEG